MWFNDQQRERYQRAMEQREQRKRQMEQMRAQAAAPRPSMPQPQMPGGMNQQMPQQAASRMPQQAPQGVNRVPGPQQPGMGGPQPQSLNAQVVQPGQQLGSRGGGRMVAPGQSLSQGNARMASQGQDMSQGRRPAAPPPQFSMPKPGRPAGVGRPQTSPEQQAAIAALRGGRPSSAGPKALGQGGNWGAERSAERRKQYAQGPKPSAATLRDLEWKRKDPAGYYGMKSLDTSKDRLSSQWMSNEGLITGKGHRISADTLRDQGYMYQTAKDGTPVYSEDYNYGGDNGGRAAGWVKQDKMVQNPYYREGPNVWEEGYWFGGDDRDDFSTNQQVTRAQLAKYEAEKKRKRERNHGSGIYSMWSYDDGGGR